MPQSNERPQTWDGEFYVEDMTLTSDTRARAPIDDLIDDVLVRIAYQPVVNLATEEIFGYEALARPQHPDFPDPMTMIDAAIAVDRLGELGRIMRALAVDGCTQHPLLINVRPEEFAEGWLVRSDDPVYWHGHLVYLELTESAPLHAFKQCQSILTEVRSKGVRLAIDDLGSGFSNLKYLVDYPAELVKLDQSLVSGLRRGTRMFRLVRWIVRMCQNLGSQVIAECIETPAELAAVIEAGVQFGQGYLLGKPNTVVEAPLWPDEYALLAESATRGKPEAERVRHLGLVLELGAVTSIDWELPSFEFHCTSGLHDAARYIRKESVDCIVIHCARDEVDTLAGAAEHLLLACGGTIVPLCLAAAAGGTEAMSELTHGSFDAFIDASWPSRAVDIILLAGLQRVKVGRKLAIQDDLTLLYNRRYYETVITSEHERSRRYGRPYSIIIVDLDGLKAINLAHGHLAGSTAIREVGAVIFDSCRKSDLAFRYGGDEFCILLPETNSIGAKKVADRLRQQIEECAVEFDGHRLNVTGSFGIASFPDDGTQRDEVFKSADEALYAAKHAGKNQVMLSKPDSP